MSSELASMIQAAVDDYEQWWLGVDLEIQRVVASCPDHSSEIGVFTKVTMINRLYMTGLERHDEISDPSALAPAARVARCLVEHGAELDSRIRALRSLESLNPADLAVLVDTHGWLVRTLRAAKVSRTVSFSSKYLHFHAPIVPIFDSIAYEALGRFAESELGHSFRVTKELIPATAYYASEYRWLVARFAELYRRVQDDDCRPGTTVKELDHLLWGRTPWDAVKP